MPRLNKSVHIGRGRLRCFAAAALTMAAFLPGAAMAQQDDDAQHRPDSVYDAPPLTPEMIGRLRARFDQGQRLLDDAGDPDQIALPVRRTVSVAFMSGGVTNIIQLARGYGTAISFVDSTGQPWPIAWDANSNKSGGCEGDRNREGNAGHAVLAPGADSCIPVPGSNVLQLQPRSKYPRGDLIVTLKGAPKPLVFIWVAKPGQYDADLTVRVRDRGPNARADMPLLTDMPATGSPDLNKFIDGTPPVDAIPLLVRGISADDVQGWKLNGHYYLRTQYEVENPGPTSGTRVGSTYAFELPVSPVVYLWVNQNPLKIELSEDAS
ncbi:MAG: DotH/IcmK family type IV secretion protein [Gluconacetobacter sp.]